MTTQVPPKAASPPRPRVGSSVGQITFGILLLLIGVAWLLQMTDAVRFEWGMVLSIALMVIGAVLVAGSRWSGWGGLIGIGVVLTLILTGMSVVDVRFAGGVGDRTERPVTVSQIQARYDLGMGTQTIDLRDVSFAPGVMNVQAGVGIGTLVVQVPSDVSVQVHFKVGAGDAQILGRRYAGAGLDQTYTSPGYDTAAKKVNLELNVGVGNIEVRQ